MRACTDGGLKQGRGLGFGGVVASLAARGRRVPATLKCDCAPQIVPTAAAAAAAVTVQPLPPRSFTNVEVDIGRGRAARLPEAFNVIGVASMSHRRSRAARSSQATEHGRSCSFGVLVVQKIPRWLGKETRKRGSWLSVGFAPTVARSHGTSAGLRLGTARAEASIWAGHGQVVAAASIIVAFNEHVVPSSPERLGREHGAGAAAAAVVAALE